MDCPSYPSYFLPMRPYSVIDALNRRVSAVSSPAYASATAYADYNGHDVGVSWNDYRQYYVAEYHWAGRQVLARGAFNRCLDAAIDDYDRGALGASVFVHPNDDDAIAMCETHPRLRLWSPEIENAETATWLSWRHGVAAASVRDYCFRGQIVIIFDYELLMEASDRVAYEEALKIKYGRVYA